MNRLQDPRIGGVRMSMLCALHRSRLNNGRTQITGLPLSLAQKLKDRVHPSAIPYDRDTPFALPPPRVRLCAFYFYSVIICLHMSQH